MTNLTRRKALASGCAAAAILAAPTAAATVGRAGDREVLSRYLTWLTQERMDVGHCLGVISADGRMLVTEYPEIVVAMDAMGHGTADLAGRAGAVLRGLGVDAGRVCR